MGITEIQAEYICDDDNSELGIVSDNETDTQLLNYLINHKGHYEAWLNDTVHLSNGTTDISTEGADGDWKTPQKCILIRLDSDTHSGEFRKEECTDKERGFICMRKMRGHRQTNVITT